MSAIRRTPEQEGHLPHMAALMAECKHGEGITILVAEDDDDHRDLLRTLLARRGFGVLEAADGRQAVELARAARPDLILMDLKMPVMNGLAAARAIRLAPEPHLRAVPIVALSAYHPSHHGAVASAAGFDDYLLKPVGYRQFEAVIDRLLKSGGKARKSATSPIRNRPSPSSARS